MVLLKKQVGRVAPVAVSRLALHLVISTSVDTWILSAIYNSQMFSDH